MDEVHYSKDGYCGQVRSLDDDDDPAICTMCGCTRDTPRATEHTNSVAANSTYITGIGTCPEKVWLSLNQGRIVTCFRQAVDNIERLQCYSTYHGIGLQRGNYHGSPNP